MLAALLGAVAAQNWLIGSTGTIVEDTTFGPQPSGNYDSHGTPVAWQPVRDQEGSNEQERDCRQVDEHRQHRQRPEDEAPDPSWGKSQESRAR